MDEKPNDKEVTKDEEVHIKIFLFVIFHKYILIKSKKNNRHLVNYKKKKISNWKIMFVGKVEIYKIIFYFFRW